MIYIEELKDYVSQKKQSEIGRVLLSKGLQIEYGLTELPKIAFGQFGKPYFKDYPDIHFNISHCKKGVVCAISSQPIGIDIECINKLDEELAAYISNEKELQEIIKSKSPSLAFTILWTKKESFVKLTGQGLNTREEIQKILIKNPTKFHTLINEAGGYVITSCSIKI